MKRYRFRLEQVLRVRRTEQERAQAALLAATLEANAQAQALAERDAAYARAVAVKVSGRAADFVFEQAQRTAYATAVLTQRGRLAEAEQAVHAARSAWTAAAARVGALERLDERQRAEHAAQALREDELIVDDLVVSRVGTDR